MYIHCIAGYVSNAAPKTWIDQENINVWIGKVSQQMQMDQYRPREPHTFVILFILVGIYKRLPSNRHI